MSEHQPHDITLERIKRLSEATADMMESMAAQSRHVNRTLERMEAGFAAQSRHVNQTLERMEARLEALASEQVLLGNRVENAFSRALRANIRIDDIEDAAAP